MTGDRGFPVIPAKAGIRNTLKLTDSGVRRNDGEKSGVTSVKKENIIKFVFHKNISEEQMMAKDTCILIVDDFPIMRGIIRRMLTKRFNLNNIIEADDGLAAWDILDKGKVDMIICDWNMPNMTGIALLKKVRADKRLAHLPFVMVTAEGKKENVIEATKAGVTGFIVKPFTAKDLGKKLSLILQDDGGGED